MRQWNKVHLPKQPNQMCWCWWSERTQSKIFPICYLQLSKSIKMIVLMSSVDGLVSLAPFENQCVPRDCTRAALIGRRPAPLAQLDPSALQGGRGDRRIFVLTSCWELRSRKLTQAHHHGSGDQNWFGRMLGKINRRFMTLIPLEGCLNMEWMTTEAK